MTNNERTNIINTARKIDNRTRAAIILVVDQDEELKPTLTINSEGSPFFIRMLKQWFMRYVREDETNTLNTKL